MLALLAFVGFGSWAVLSTSKRRQLPGQGEIDRQQGTASADAWTFRIEGSGGTLTTALELPAVVGRSSSAGLHVLEPDVSGYHARLTAEGGAVRVTDLGSSNGTFVAGEPIAEALLRPGEAFRVGAATIVFESGPRRGGEGVSGRS